MLQLSGVYCKPSMTIPFLLHLHAHRIHVGLHFLNGQRSLHRNRLSVACIVVDRLTGECWFIRVFFV